MSSALLHLQYFSAPPRPSLPGLPPFPPPSLGYIFLWWFPVSFCTLSYSARSHMYPLPPASAGQVWGACDELTRGPLDNRASLFRQLADVMSGIKGAAKEVGARG
jgi:hypothetical protein